VSLGHLLISVWAVSRRASGRRPARSRLADHRAVAPRGSGPIVGAATTSAATKRRRLALSLTLEIGARDAGGVDVVTPCPALVSDRRQRLMQSRAVAGCRCGGPSTTCRRRRRVPGRWARAAVELPPREAANPATRRRFRLQWSESVHFGAKLLEWAMFDFRPGNAAIAITRAVLRTILPFS
jgi:hypothetical protein